MFGKKKAPAQLRRGSGEEMVVSAVVVSAERNDKRVIGCEDRVVAADTELERSETFAIAIGFDADDRWI